jgi:phosphonate degradation associated HDIG domain protein
MTGVGMSLTLQDISSLLNSRATTWYGQEAVSQLEHALQCAHLAQKANETTETIVAALLHDLGHILTKDSPNKFSDDATLPIKDDLHQYVALPFLRDVFSDAVLEPIKLHVEAKRYLCAVDTRYWDSLSPVSKHSLELQGGIFNEVQVKEFEQLPYASEATRLRRYDDLAKVAGLSTPSLSHYEGLMKEIALIS